MMTNSENRDMPVILINHMNVTERKGWQDYSYNHLFSGIILYMYDYAFV